MSNGLPPKLYFRIGEVSSLVGVEPHVLRYWEREFRVIRPTKSAKGQRVYSRRDVENLQRVRELLYTEGFTIAGARKKLTGVQKQAAVTEAPLESDGVSENATTARLGGEGLSGALAFSPDASEGSAGWETQSVAATAVERPMALRAAKTPAEPPDEPPRKDARERTLAQLRELRSEVQAFLEELGG